MTPHAGTVVPMFVSFHDAPKRSDSANVGWIVAANDCHLWQGARNNAGYGRVQVEGRMQLVHRVRYEQEVGPIPEGMDLDHFVCDTPRCCNPLHVRPVTHRENLLRGDTVNARCAAKNHCLHGHPLADENLLRSELARGYRACRACRRVWSAAWRARRAAIKQCQLVAP